MKLSEFVYDLPEELIAQSPLEDRAASRLLHLDKTSGSVEHRRFRDVESLLLPGDLLVMNDTRVSALRLFGQRPTGGKVELLLLHEERPGLFHALARPGKKLKPGETVEIEGELSATIVEDLGDGKKSLEFSESDYKERLAEVGRVPLPPYIRSQITDPSRYQTVYAAHEGSAAAPTAGLHFTEEVLDGLRAIGVSTAHVTLDVSLDTFRPIQVDDVEEHVMHGETCRVPEQTAEAIAGCKGRVVAVGTTTVRTLETFAKGHRRVEPGEACSRLFIKPGFEFRAVDGMFTNFHMPGTTMMLLVAALCGRGPLMRAYEEAVSERYRFLSFGDSMLVI